MFKFEEAADVLHKDMRRKVLSCMETGNFTQARTVVLEYVDEYPEQGKDLNNEVLAAYGTSLLA